MPNGQTRPRGGSLRIPTELLKIILIFVRYNLEKFNFQESVYKFMKNDPNNVGG
jgi:hypothetical protein